MSFSRFISLILIPFAAFLGPTALATVAPDGLDVRTMGAKGDGKTNDTRALQQAIDNCSSRGGGQVLVPAGAYLTGPLQLKSHVDLHLSIGAMILGSPHLADYLNGQEPAAPVKDKSFAGRRSHPAHQLALITAEDLDDVSISGPGTINGSGGSSDFDRGDNDPFRPKILLFHHCRDVRITDITLRDSATWVQHYLGCKRVRISGVRVYSHANLNNDGLDIDSSDVNVSDCIIDSDDDGICLKSETDQPCQNVTVSNCVVGSNCNAIKFGTASRNGFININIQNCAIRAASEHRQRAWKDTISGLSLEMVDGGVMDRVAVSNLTMSDVQTAIFIRFGARSRQGADAPPSVLRNVTISNIAARSDSPISNSITGIPGAMAQNITLSHIILDCPGGGTEAMATRPVPEKDNGYPENRMFGPSLPAYGFYVRHVRDLTLEDVQLHLLQSDQRPAIVLDDVDGARLSGLDMDAPSGGAPMVSLRAAKYLFIDGCRVRRENATFIEALDKQSAAVRIANNEIGSATPIKLVTPSRKAAEDK